MSNRNAPYAQMESRAQGERFNEIAGEYDQCEDTLADMTCKHGEQQESATQLEVRRGIFR